MPGRSKSIKWIGAVAVAVLLGLLLGGESRLYAFQVPELPGDNLIVNPWFRSATDPNAPGLDGWTNVLTDGVGWVLSQKESNPSPDIVVSGRCAGEPVYCGTSARWAKIVSGPHAGKTFPNIDVYLYQVVAAGPAHRKLTFFTHWVSHRVAAAEVTVYGSQAPDGPWELVWTPFFHSQDDLIIPPSGDVTDLWEETGFLETTLDQGYSHYKVQFRARLPEGDSVGFKMTGVYFTVAAADGEETPPTPTETVKSRTTATSAPTSTPFVGPGVTPTPTTTPGATATPTTKPSVTPAPTTTPAATSTPTTKPSATSTPTTTPAGDQLLLSATALSPTQIELAWQDGAANQRGYAVERSLDGVSGWTTAGRLDSGVMTYVDEGLSPATTYFYRVRTAAVDGARTSNVHSVTTPQ